MFVIIIIIIIIIIRRVHQNMNTRFVCVCNCFARIHEQQTHYLPKNYRCPRPSSSFEINNVVLNIGYGFFYLAIRLFHRIWKISEKKVTFGVRHDWCCCSQLAKSNGTNQTDNSAAVLCDLCRA